MVAMKNINSCKERRILQLCKIYYTVLSYAGVVCEGHDDDEYVEGTTIQEIFINLYIQFCGCKIVSGNIQIDMTGLSNSSIPGPNSNRTSLNLSENAFNSLYHLEQVYGAILLRNIPRIANRIILPNLRLIRGRELIFGYYALVLENVDVGEFILPNLTEISQGSVLVNQPRSTRLCNIFRVNWPDILDNGTLEASNLCTNPQGLSDGSFAIHWLAL